MPTKKRTISIVVDDETAKRFDDFRYNNRIKTESRAGYILLIAGMDALKKEYPELARDNSADERPQVHP